MIGAVIVMAIAWRIEPPLFARRTRGKRLLSSLSLLALLATLFAGMPGWVKIYGGDHLWLEPWSASATADHSGLVSSLLMFHLHQGHARRNPDTTAAAAADRTFRRRLARSA